MTILPRKLSIFLILAFAFAFTACDSNDNGNGGGEFDISLYTGEAYTGAIFADVMVPGEETQSGSGTGSAQIVDLGNGEARLTLIAETGGEPSSFPFEGGYDTNGWTITTINGSEIGTCIYISANGGIDGECGDDTADLSFEGAISANQLDVLWRITLLTDANEFGLPSGTVIEFTWTLDRGQPALTSQIEASTEREFNREGGEFSVGALVGRVLEMLDKSE